MTWAVALLLGLHPIRQQPPADRWFGLDKWKHFAASSVIQSVSYGVALRNNGHSASLRVGAAAVVTIGIGKELRDLRVNHHFSKKDLVWDVLGGAVTAVALHAVR